MGVGRRQRDHRVVRVVRQRRREAVQHAVLFRHEEHTPDDVTELAVDCHVGSVRRHRERQRVTVGVAEAAFRYRNRGQMSGERTGVPEIRVAGVGRAAVVARRLAREVRRRAARFVPDRVRACRVAHRHRLPGVHRPGQGQDDVTVSDRHAADAKVTAGHGHREVARRRYRLRVQRPVVEQHQGTGAHRRPRQHRALRLVGHGMVGEPERMGARNAVLDGAIVVPGVGHRHVPARRHRIGQGNDHRTLHDPYRTGGREADRGAVHLHLEVVRGGYRRAVQVLVVGQRQGGAVDRCALQRRTLVEDRAEPRRRLRRRAVGVGHRLGDGRYERARQCRRDAGQHACLGRQDHHSVSDARHRRERAGRVHAHRRRQRVAIGVGAGPKASNDP